ncbi:MAG: Asd/ArgC dimerization domain-containing protein, partial [Acidobacteriaceae bacterium]
PLHGFAVTLLQPASEHGHAALEELHQQTTNLLAFQPLPTNVFGGQTAFSLAVSFSGEGRVEPEKAAETILRHYAMIALVAPGSLGLQVIQVPVFHGYALSIAVEFESPVATQALMRALVGSHIHIVPDVRDFPGNVQAVEESDMQVLVRPVVDSAKALSGQHAANEDTRRFWYWVVADNLKLAAQNAIACAAELNRLRPRGSVQ